MNIEVFPFQSRISIPNPFATMAAVLQTYDGELVGANGNGVVNGENVVRFCSYARPMNLPPFHSATESSAADGLNSRELE